MSTLSDIFTVLAAFSVLVFVHELGHYLAARAVGIRVERFFLFMDFFGLALKKEIRGVTYGLGAFPLGGYVKLAGQSDDPRYEEITGAPDEFRSKPLWAQSLVLVAGVTMNLILGFALILYCFMAGKPSMSPIVGKVEPQSPAHTAGLMTGDEVLQINEFKVRTFEDLQQYIVSYPEEKFRIKVKRMIPDDETGALEPRIITTDAIKGVPAIGTRGELNSIGVGYPYTPVIETLPEVTETAFSDLTSQLKIDDRILSLNGTPIPEHAGHAFFEMIRTMPGEMVTLKIARPQPDGDPQPMTVKTHVGATGLYDIGLGMAVTVSSVSQGSPAEKAGLKVGDRITQARTVDGTFSHLVGPSDLIARTKAQAYQSIALTFLRDGTEKQAHLTPKYMVDTIRITEKTATYLGALATPTEKQGFILTQVFPDGPAAGSLKPGDILIAAEGEPLDTSLDLGAQIIKASTRPLILKLERTTDDDKTVELIKEIRPSIAQGQGTPQIGIGISSGPTKTWNQNRVTWIRTKNKGPGKPDIANANGIQVGDQILGYSIDADLQTTTVQYRDRDGAVHSIVFLTPPAVRKDPFAFGLRGYLPITLKFSQTFIQYKSLGAALWPSLKETGRMSIAIYNVLHKITTGQISPKAMSGPVMIVKMIKRSSDQSFIELLWLLALISINLAVFNLLPFPVLDGGHLVFILWEWITGKPPSLKVKEYAQYAGIICLLGLMLLVTGFDIFL